MAEVERGWFQRGVAGEQAPPRYCSRDNADGDFDDADTADVAGAFGAWASDCERARQIAAATPSLDVTFTEHDHQASLRWLMVHMIEEYARHNGHADLLRERIDGVTGD